MGRVHPFHTVLKTARFLDAAARLICGMQEVLHVPGCTKKCV
ncbi:hypothetical protein [Yeguia hominis]|nr:hypothetical protein [Yeguia hominis]